MVNTSTNTPSNESTPVTLIKHDLESYLTSSGRTIDQASASAFTISGKSASSTVWISGDTGQLSNSQKSIGQLGELASLKGQGSEFSQCDAGSGRTISQASAQASVSTSGADSLRFEYSAAAQGGHYVTAVSCLGDLPVGLTGHDTSAEAHLELASELEFSIAAPALSLVWSGMPQSGAAVVLTRDGQTLNQQRITGGGRQKLSIPDAGKYRLNTTISVDLKSRGTCCGLSQSANATIEIAPTSGGLTQQ